MKKTDGRKNTYRTIQQNLVPSACTFGEFRKAGHSVDFHHDNGAVYRLSLKTIKPESLQEKNE